MSKLFESRRTEEGIRNQRDDQKRLGVVFGEVFHSALLSVLEGESNPDLDDPIRAQQKINVLVGLDPRLQSVASQFAKNGPVQALAQVEAQKKILKLVSEDTILLWVATHFSEKGGPVLALAQVEAQKKIYELAADDDVAVFFKELKLKEFSPINNLKEFEAQQKINMLVANNLEAQEILDTVIMVNPHMLPSQILARLQSLPSFSKAA